MLCFQPVQWAGTAGIAPAGHRDEAAIPYIHDEGLFIGDQRIGFPPVAAPCLVKRQAAFEVGGPVDLSGPE